MNEINKSITGRKKVCPKCRRIYEASDQVCLDDHSLLQPEPDTSSPKHDTPIGTVLADRYEILSEVGRGGMSIVYKSRHLLMDKVRAIKMLLSQLMYDQTSKKRFQQEALAASCLEHPNIIAVHDFGVAPTGQPYLVMDFLVGESLAELIKREKKVEQKRALKIFIQACDALSHAHKKGVIHRDLKSSNIMLINDENRVDIVKVLDFGIAKLMPASGKLPQNLTQTGEVFGSPIYMSPEQCLGQTLDERSDIYSMGTMFYEALTGVPPLVGNTIVDTMQMHVATKPPAMSTYNIEVHPQLEAIIFKALEKKPENRYSTMEEMFDALEEMKFLFTNGGTSRTKQKESTNTNVNDDSQSQNYSQSSIKAEAEKSLLRSKMQSTSPSSNWAMERGLFLATVIILIVFIMILLFFINSHH